MKLEKKNCKAFFTIKNQDLEKEEFSLMNL